MFVIPVGKVRDPVTKRHLPAEGKDVAESTYWHRRLASGCVTLAPPVPAVVVQEDVIQIPDFEAESN